jgi:KaiC/GvpD/RAD55 family RecA-like ATPase
VGAVSGVTDYLTDAQLEAMVRGAKMAPRLRPDGRPYRMVKPLSVAAESLVAFASQPERRVMLGLPEIDEQTMGVGPGELAYVTGFSHSGKTQVILNALLQQRDKRAVILTADEPASLVLSKLVAISRGISGRELIERIQAGDRSARDMVYSVAEEDWPNLLVVDGSLSFDDLTIGVEECSDYWGDTPQIVVVDYLGLIRGAGGDDDQGTSIVNNSRRLKSWTMENDLPVIAMHQGTRSGSGKGQAADLSTAAAYGGEAEAIFLLNVRRKKTAILSEIAALEAKEYITGSLTAKEEHQLGKLHLELPHHENTITVQLLKSKRPGSRLTPPSGIDYRIDPHTGIISTLTSTRHPRAMAPIQPVPVTVPAAVPTPEPHLWEDF